MQEPWLSPKAGIPPLFLRKEKLMSMPNDQPSWVEALHASLKLFLIVWFSDGFWLFYIIADHLGIQASLLPEFMK